MMSQSTRKPYPIFFSYLGYAIFSLFLAAAVLEISSAIVLSVYRHIRTRKSHDAPSASPAYQGYPWAQEFWKEEYLRWGSHTGPRYVPFLVWGERPWHSKYINVDESALGNLRRTVNTTNPACDQTRRKVVWMFGGSTLFGTGVPDWATIPSYLSQELNTTGATCFLVLNLGVEGYLTNQEVIFLTELLKTGQRPDMAIFYDGVNDSAAAVSPGIPNAYLDFDFMKARFEGSLSSKVDFLRNSHSIQLAKAIGARLRHGEPSIVSPAEVAARASSAMQNYEANIRVVRMLGEAYKFKVFCFWQPSLATGHKPLAPFERQIWNVGGNFPDAVGYKILRAVNEEAARRALQNMQNSSFVFLGQIFDSVQEPIYVDNHMHVGPLGNQIAAHAIAKWIEVHQEN
jgi:hypothetical protein